MQGGHRESGLGPVSACEVVGPKGHSGGCVGTGVVSE